MDNLQKILSSLLKLKITSVIFLSIFLSSIFIIPSYAGKIPVTRLVEDLKVADAALISFPNGLFLLNKGSSGGVKKGELWTVFSAGESVKDPVTGKKLGFFQVPVAKAKITSIAENFSQISLKLHDKSQKIKSGLTARRFDKIETLFQDSDGSHFSGYETLRAKLPHLNWKGYLNNKKEFKTAAGYSGILITVLKDRLTVWCEGEVLGIYKLKAENLSSRSYTEIDIAKRTAAQIRPDRLLLPGIRTPGLNREAALQSYNFVKTFDDLIYNIKICEIDGLPYYIYLTRQGIYAQKTDGSGQVVQYKYNGFGEIAGISIGQNGLIALNILVKYKGMESQVLKFENNKFNLLADNIHYILGFFDLNGNGHSESLIGQEYNQENFYGLNRYHFQIKKKSIKKGKRFPSLSGFELFGSFQVDLDGNGKNEVGFYNIGRKLNIYEDGKKKWGLLSPLGGSLQSFQISRSDDEAILRNIIVWSEPAILNMGTQKGVAMVTNKSNIISSVIDINPHEGGVAILLADKTGRFFLNSIDINFQGPVQSVFFYNDMLYCLVIEGDYFSKAAKSHLIKFSLNEFKAALKINQNSMH